MLKAICAVLVMLGAAVAVPAAGHASAPSPAFASATCNISGKERKLGTTYVTSVTAKGVACSKALTFVKAFHSCRRKDGVEGRCSRLQGYSCSEKRQAIATQYDSVATCRNGSRRIVQTYTQNT